MKYFCYVQLLIFVGITRIPTENSAAIDSGVDPISCIITPYFSTYAGSIALISGLSSISDVPSTMTTSSPRFVSSSARVTRAFLRRLRIFCFSGWLKMSSVFPSHKNQTGTVYGRPSDPTVVSQPIMLVRKRCSACYPHSVVTSSIHTSFLARHCVQPFNCFTHSLNIFVYRSHSLNLFRHSNDELKPPRRNKEIRGFPNYHMLDTPRVGTGVWMMGGGALALSWCPTPVSTSVFVPVLSWCPTPVSTSVFVPVLS